MLVAGNRLHLAVGRVQEALLHRADGRADLGEIAGCRSANRAEHAAEVRDGASAAIEADRIDYAVDVRVPVCHTVWRSRLEAESVVPGIGAAIPQDGREPA